MSLHVYYGLISGDQLNAYLQRDLTVTPVIPEFLSKMHSNFYNRNDCASSVKTNYLLLHNTISILFQMDVLLQHVNHVVHLVDQLHAVLHLVIQLHGVPLITAVDELLIMFENCVVCIRNNKNF